MHLSGDKSAQLTSLKNIYFQQPPCSREYLNKSVFAVSVEKGQGGGDIALE